MNAYEYSNKYRGNPILPLSEFLDEHRDHCIIECNEAIHQWPMVPQELSSAAGRDAVVEYLGERSPHFVKSDALFFVIRGGTVTEIHVVVYVF